jgi:hypothetical protein
MFRKLMLGVLVAAGALALGFATVAPANAETPPKPLPRVVVYVESQGLCFDSVVTAQNVPPNGPFQLLESDPDNHCGSGLKTAFGPGDVGYVGGRWMMNTPNGPVYFLCPLLGPGYAP